MPQLMEADQVGKRQELADFITNIEAQATPVTSMIKKGSKPKQTLIECQVEGYPDVGHNGVMDGADVSSFSHVARKKLQVRPQKFWYNPSVSDFAEESDVAGIRSEMAHQKILGLVLIKRMLEQRILSDEDTKEDDGGSQPNETRGLFSWCDPDAQTLYPVHEDFRTPSDSIYTDALDDLSEEDFCDLLQSSYNEHKRQVSLKGICGSALKRHVSGFSLYSDDVTSKTSTRTFNQDAKSKAIINTIDRLVTDAGDVDLMLSSFLKTAKADGAASANTTRSGLILDMSMLELRYTRMPRIKDLEDRGGGPRAIIDLIAGLVCKNPRGQVVLDIDD